MRLLYKPAVLLHHFPHPLLPKQIYRGCFFAGFESPVPFFYRAGTTQSTADYDTLWALYDKIDPGMNSGDLLLNIDIKAETGAQLKVTTDSTNLNIRSTPSLEGAIVGKAAHNEIVTLVEKTDDSWWKVKTKDGEEGYAYAQYLSPL
jgi:uncharacterized protein YgiM (DUF1202 family)